MPETFIFMLGFLLIVTVLLALPFCTGDTEFCWSKFRRGMLVSVFGVIVPLLGFFFSFGLTAYWKGDAPHGWTDCLHQGKFALTPLLLWSTFSLYFVEQNPTERLKTRALAIGLVLGCLLAGACFAYGVWDLQRKSESAPFLSLPLYVCIWHGARSLQAIRQDNTSWKPCLITTFCTTPLWILAGIWSQRIYNALPDTPPHPCFVVGAAAHGHPKLVGRWTSVQADGQFRPINQQLLTFWEFESLWRQRSPQSPRFFRTAYNLTGPLIAGCIFSPWIADVVYLVLKPLEWAAHLALWTANRN